MPFSGCFVDSESSSVPKGGGAELDLEALAEPHFQELPPPRLALLGLRPRVTLRWGQRTQTQTVQALA